ncbi:cob(I)yrinic acid a,c-diamide adenosyltransferase [Cohnella nanjingensis]|uniref:Corrinoid adenosyltransferase n=1 Tax=Cohnella nanjingensis TaxID=1387779 RepID=A0A7X0RLG8_9BACL|nr:cob(I)yrinic acid a,c-diamide adenosyltransferase [Cohnella nanjingensis]MBB6669704.1 cob(I)yrinic acid a,c-diamide adenosyltransferase [Cohnella nanjingensis]
MKLYTRTGDEGRTSVIGGRVSKDDARVEAYGTIDELNAFVGQTAAAIARAQTSSGEGAREGQPGWWDDLLQDLTVVQHELFDCGSDLSYAAPAPEQLKVSPEMTARVEGWIDRLEAETPPIQRFILPGGSEAAALFHVCRTVCRRAERRVVTLAAAGQPCPAEVRTYLNRLSDYFFAAARAANARLGVGDIEYERGANVFKRDKE